VSPLDITYHDVEWGVPVHDDRRLFEFLILEGAQAGLSWSTILRKRDNYREAFAGFDPARVARFTPAKVERLAAGSRDRAPPVEGRERDLKCTRIPRHTATSAVRSMRTRGDSWAGNPVDGRRRSMRDVPATTPESDALSGDLKRRGFRFVGSTICYAFMQAVGMANDHLLSCFRHREVGR
jgi:DNA-3-methyladenine glycosylase I